MRVPYVLAPELSWVVMDVAAAARNVSASGSAAVPAFYVFSVFCSCGLSIVRYNLAQMGVMMQLLSKTCPVWRKSSTSCPSARSGMTMRRRHCMAMAEEEVAGDMATTSQICWVFELNI